MKPKPSLPDAAFVAVIAIAVIAHGDAAAQRPSKQQATIAAPVLTVDDFALAVVNDRDAEVKAMLARGMDPETVGPDGNPVLVTAAREGSARVVDVAARRGRQGRQRERRTATPRSSSPRCTAICGSRRSCVRAARASIAQGWTPLIYAATGGHDDMVRYLLAEGANVNAVSPNGTTALMMAVREEKFSTAEL